MLEKSQMVSLLQQVSPILEALTITQCDLMRGIQFPALTSLEQCENLADSRYFDEEAIQSCPQIRELRVCFSFRNDLFTLLSRQPLNVEVIISKINFDGMLNDTVGQFVNLKIFNVRCTSPPAITNRFFANMHKLEVLQLHYCGRPDQPKVAGEFSDTGVQILLRNNQQLRKVQLCGFLFTDRSLQLFTDYVSSHGLVKLTLQSMPAAKFSWPALRALADTGFANKLRKCRISVAGTDQIFQP